MCCKCVINEEKNTKKFLFFKVTSVTAALTSKLTGREVNGGPHPCVCYISWTSLKAQGRKQKPSVERGR